VAVGYRWIWLSNVCDRTVSRLDPRTGALTRIGVAGEPWSISLGAGAAWVSTGLGLQRIVGESAEATTVSPQSNTLSAYGHGVVWFLDCWGCERASLRAIAASDLREIGAPIRLPR
jgi:streptogramin lyase